jgi:PadR family transcriptional regulator PadR
MSRRLIPDLLPGTLDLLILRTLQTEALHGWAISERIQQISGGRRAKYYRLSGSGRRQLAVEAREWERMSAAIARVMKFA